MTVQQILARATNQLKSSSSSPSLDAEVLLALVLKTYRTNLLINVEQRLSWLELWRFQGLIAKRNRGWPVAYLTGNKEFYGRNYKVTPKTLIPRPETELLVEKIIGIIRAQRPVDPPPAGSLENGSIKTIADIGTGSGCIAITLALELPIVKIIATDISPNALKVANLNANLLGGKGRIDFRLGNLLEVLENEKLDLVAANLPYLTKEEYNANPELKFEPKEALLEPIGLFDEFCRQIAKHNEIKFILLETSPRIINRWLATLKKFYSTSAIFILPDLSGSSRLIIIDTNKALKV
ncbi:MAG: HemK/PrmC family methyltransferase [Patescibacteria group bacterium]